MQLVATILKKANLQPALNIHYVFIHYLIFSRIILQENKSLTWLLIFMTMWLQNRYT